MNLVLQLVLLPVFVTALPGAAADIPLADLAVSVAMVLGIPVAVAALARVAAACAGAQDRLDTMLERLQPVGLGLLAVAIVAIFVAHARVVTDNPGAFLRLLLPLGLFFAATYLVATATAGGLRLAHAERVTLTMTTLARNSPVALAIATAAFPDRPLVAVALVVAPSSSCPSWLSPPTRSTAEVARPWARPDRFAGRTVAHRAGREGVSVRDLDVYLQPSRSGTDHAARDARGDQVTTTMTDIRRSHMPGDWRSRQDENPAATAVTHNRHVVDRLARAQHLGIGDAGRLFEEMEADDEPGDSEHDLSQADATPTDAQVSA